jgi:transaldolase
LQRLVNVGLAPIFYQLIGSDQKDLVGEAEKVREIVGDKLVLMIPPTEAGFRYMQAVGADVPCGITAVFTPQQALVAREAGARYVMMHLAKASGEESDGAALVETVAKALAKSETELIVTNVADAESFVAAFNAGADHVSLPYYLLEDVIADEHTESLLEEFRMMGTRVRW